MANVPAPANLRGMSRRVRPFLASLLALAACKPADNAPAKTAPPAPAPALQPAPIPDDDMQGRQAVPDAKKPMLGPMPAPIADMDAAIKALMAKPVLPVENVELQHVLIAFQGVPRVRGVTRSKDEAKALAQKVYADAIGGADFGELVKKYTNHSAPGIYRLVKSKPEMAQGFIDVGFRLRVGEIGVSPWEADASPFGWHIIKRLK